MFSIAITWRYRFLEVLTTLSAFICPLDSPGCVPRIAASGCARPGLLPGRNGRPFRAAAPCPAPLKSRTSPYPTTGFRLIFSAILGSGCILGGKRSEAIESRQSIMGSAHRRMESTELSIKARLSVRSSYQLNLLRKNKFNSIQSGIKTC